MWNQRMIQFMDHCVTSGDAPTQRDFLESIGFPFRNIAQLRSGRQGFTVEHIKSAAQLYDLNVNWLLGLEPTVKRKPAKSPLQQLRDAVKAVEVCL